MKTAKGNEMTEGKIERCLWCNEPTGRAGGCEDSLYSNDEGIGPFCERCWDDLRDTFSDDIGHSMRTLKCMTNIARSFSDWAAIIDHYILDESHDGYSKRRERIEEDFESVLKMLGNV
jgi:hypothetical protein